MKKIAIVMAMLATFAVASAEEQVEWVGVEYGETHIKISDDAAPKTVSVTDAKLYAGDLVLTATAIDCELSHGTATYELTFEGEADTMNAMTVELTINGKTKQIVIGAPVEEVLETL